MLVPKKCFLFSLTTISLLSCYYFVGNAMINPIQIATNAVLCLNNKFEQIYSECDEEYRLNQSGDLHVPCEATNRFCHGPCLSETRKMLKCIDKLASGFIFLNKATTEIIRNTLDSGCSYTPLRGVFIIGNEHTETCNLISSAPAAGFQFDITLIVVLCSIIILLVI